MDSSPQSSPNPDPNLGSPDTPQPPDKAGEDTNSATGSVIAPPSAVPSSTAAIEIGVLGKVETLSEEELVEYQTCETIVSMAWQNFVEAGLALARIRDRRLYRIEFKGFEDYCRARWQYGRHYVNRLIAASEIFAHLVPICHQAKPDHESQIRPLIGLTHEQAHQAWDLAAQKAAGHRVTARLVKASVRELKLTPAEKEAPAIQGPDKAELRRLVRETMIELLTLLNQRADHSALVQKAESLHHQIEEAFAVRKRNSSTANTL